MLNPPNKYLAGMTLEIRAGQPRNSGRGDPAPTDIGQIVGYFKYQLTKQINQIRDNIGCPVWQPNYYERVIRDERELDARKYIVENQPNMDIAP